VGAAAVAAISERWGCTLSSGNGRGVVVGAAVAPAAVAVAATAV